MATHCLTWRISSIYSGFPLFLFDFFLTQFEARVGQFVPHHHTFVCSFHRRRAHQNWWVCFSDYLNSLRKHIFEISFSKFIVNCTLKFFGVLEYVQQIEKDFENFFFTQRFFFVFLNSYCTCFQPSFEVYNSFAACNLKFWCSLAAKFQFVPLSYGVQ